MYVCVCVCMYACMYVCLYVCKCIYVYICICIHVYMYVCTFACMNALVIPGCLPYESICQRHVARSMKNQSQPSFAQHPARTWA
jgi:hypothetical protein